MRRHLQLLAGIALLALAGVACSGGSGTSPTPPQHGQGSQPQLTQNVTFTVNVPQEQKQAAGRRHSHGTVYVSPRTGSVGIQLATVDGQALLTAPPVVFGNVPLECSGSGSGCQIAVKGVPAAVGNDTFAVTTYVQQNGGGAVVSQGLVPVTVTSGSNGATIGGTTLSLGGYIASLGLTISPDQFDLGEAGSATVLLVPQDATGAVIVGNTQFAVPITIAASPSPQFQLTNGGSQGATITLTMPEQRSGLVRLLYNGSTQVVGGTVTATTQNSAGGTVTARENVAVSVAPSPTPSGQIADMYVLNGADNSLAEYAAKPVPSATPRRTFGGGKTIGCKPALGSVNGINQVALGTSGLSFDGSGNALVGNAAACASLSAHETFYALAPSAVGTATPVATYVSTDSNVQTFVGFAFDSALQFLDVSDASLSIYLYEYRLTGKSAELAAALGETQGAPTCFLTPGISACGNGQILSGTFTTYGLNSTEQFGRTFALDAGANAYYPAVENAMYQFAVLQLPLANEPANGPALANAVWLDGITAYSQAYGPADANRISNYPLAMAIDGNLLFVLNYPTRAPIFVGSKEYTPFYPPAAICNANSNATPSPVANGSLCQDATPHEFVTAYDLSKLTGSGPVALQPILVLGGNDLPGDGAAGAQFANRLAVGGGNLYIAEPAGASCDSQCLSSLGSGPVGRIAIYPESLTGSHINDAASAPSAVVQGATIKFPTAVTLGPQGTGQGSQAGERPPPRRTP